MNRPLFVGGAALVGAVFLTPALAHRDDPKILDLKPRYEGPGYRRNAAVRSAGAAGNLTVSGGASASEFPANGVVLLSWLPLTEFGTPASGNDCWGYTSPSGREYAIIGLSNATGFVEVTNPGDATLIATHSAPDSLWHDVKVYQDHAYVVSEAGSGIQVYDLSQIDSGIVTDLGDNTSGPGTTASHNVAIDEDSGFLYRVGGTDIPSFQDRGLRAYSLANPSSPTYAGEWSDKYVHDAQIVTYTSGPYAGRQIAFACSGFDQGWTATGLDIVDVTDKQNMFVRANLQYGNAEYSHQVWISPDRQTAYLNDELDEDGVFPSTTVVIDISDLDNPFEVTTFDNGNAAITHNNYTLGNLLFASNYTHGLRIWDVDDPFNASEVAFFDTFPESDSTSFNSLWSNYPYFPSGTVIGSDMEKGLFVWHVGAPTLAFSIAGGAPQTIDPGGELLTFGVTEASPGELNASTVKLHFDGGQGFVEIPVTALGGYQFQVETPAAGCGSSVNYFLSAESQNGVIWTAPEGAPAACYSAVAALGQSVLASYEMEATQGWTSGAVGDTATTGIWVRENPAGTSAQPEDDHTPVGTDCWITGQHFGGSIGDNDVDGGHTTLLSPVLDLSQSGEVIIGYWRWYSNDQGGTANDDVFVVEITDNGSTWVTAEVVGPSGPETVGGWLQHQLRVSDFVAQTNQVQLRFIAEDTGGGSIVEAAIDDLTVQEVDCPALSADTGTLSLAAGGSQNFVLDAGAGEADAGYSILGTASGTTPGFDLGLTTHVPLNVDAYTVISLTGPNQFPFTDSLGLLDGDGEATAAFTLPAGYNPNLAGVLIHHAYFTYDTVLLVAGIGSNAVSLYLVP